MDLVAHLADVSDDIFYGALSRLTPADGTVEFLAALCGSLLASTLPDRRQEQRLIAVLSKLRVGDDTLKAIINKRVLVSPAHRNALSKFASPRQRYALAGTERIPNVAAERSTANDQARGLAAQRQVDSEPPDPCSTIVVLSASAQQDANRVLLVNNGFVPLLCDTLEKLSNELRVADICGCVVDQSFLLGLSAAEQRLAFESLASYSTFIAIRVDERGLRLAPEIVTEILRAVRLHNRPVAAREVSFQPTGTIRASELGAFARASNVLRSFQAASFVPGELRENQRRLLIATAREHASELRLTGEIRVEVIETRFLTGGFSGASVALVRVNADARAVVAKIGDKQPIREELERFRTFVQPVHDELKPFASFHADSGAILFAVVTEEGEENRPAKMLDDRLKEFWFDEVNEKEIDLAYANLCYALQNAASALSKLNKTKPATSTLAGVGNPDFITSYVRRLESRVDLGLPAGLAGSRRTAKAMFATRATAAVSHGDLHLRNILIRGDRSAHLIDFAGTGPGHPAVDLARLDVELFTQFFRPVRPEDDYVTFQRRLSIDCAAFGDLVDEFDLDRGPKLNKLCVWGCVEARDHAIRVLKEHAGGLPDFVAAKYLVAWQSFLLHGRETILNRSIIRALSGSFGG